VRKRSAIIEFARQLDVVLRSYNVAHVGDAHTGHTGDAGRGQRRRRATSRRACSSARAAVSLKLLSLSGRAHVHRGAEDELRTVTVLHPLQRTLKENENDAISYGS
jgi:hypothetical protein